MIETTVRVYSEYLASMPSEAKDKVDCKCSLDELEHAYCQDKKSLAYANGKLSLEVANWLYATFGPTCDSFNDRSLAERIVAFQILEQL